jgi:hypothetical protein
MNKWITGLALMISMGAFLLLFQPSTALADNSAAMSVSTVWTGVDTLRIDVTDAIGNVSSVDLSLRDYLGDNKAGEYISVQAVDPDGNSSGVIKIKNPYFTDTDSQNGSEDAKPAESTASTLPSATAPPALETPEANANSQASETDASAHASTTGSSAGNEDPKPFTPDGTGTVMDNVTNSDGKEFFTIAAKDGKSYFLIIDPDRVGDNVYLLNEVTEDELRPLAAMDSAATVTPSPPSSVTPTIAALPLFNATSTPTVSPKPSSTAKSGRSGANTGTIVLSLVAAALAGFAGWYFKIYLPKHRQAVITQEDPDEDVQDDEAGVYEEDYASAGTDNSDEEEESK